MCLDRGKALVGGYEADAKICIDLNFLIIRIIILSYREDPLNDGDPANMKRICR